MKQLKSELVALDRKITAVLAPKHEENDGTEIKQEKSQHVKNCYRRFFTYLSFPQNPNGVRAND